MKERFNENKKSQAFDFLVEEYFKMGFGNLAKSEVDLLFFTLISKYSDIVDKSDYALSKYLQITQSRVRNMKIKEGLRYTPIDLPKALSIFSVNAKYARLENDGKKISIPIQDPNVFIELENIVEKDHGYVEFQLNPKIFTIRLDQYLNLLITFEASSSDRTTKQIQDVYSDAIRKTVREESRFSEKIDTKSLMSFDDIKKQIIEKGLDIGLDLVASSIPAGSIVKTLATNIFKSIKK